MAKGLTPDAMGRHYLRSKHPLLDIICDSSEPNLFPEGSSLPDPFDGMLISDPHALQHIHACLGCPLHINGKLVGVLTADSFDTHAFAQLPRSNENNNYYNIILPPSPF